MDDFAAKRQALLESGVRMMDPDTVYVEAGVTVGAGTLLLPGTILRGNTVVGANCEIGPNTMLTDCTVGDGAVINSSQCNESTIEAGAHVGPFAYTAAGSTITEDVPADALAIARARQVEKPGWAAAHRAKKARK